MEAISLSGGAQLTDLCSEKAEYHCPAPPPQAPLRAGPLIFSVISQERDNRLEQLAQKTTHGTYVRNGIRRWSQRQSEKVFSWLSVSTSSSTHRPEEEVARPAVDDSSQIRSTVDEPPPSAQRCASSCAVAVTSITVNPQCHEGAASVASIQQSCQESSDSRLLELLGTRCVHRLVDWEVHIGILGGAQLSSI